MYSFYYVCAWIHGYVYFNISVYINCMMIITIYSVLIINYLRSSYIDSTFSIPPDIILWRVRILGYSQRLIQVCSGLGIDHRCLGCRRGCVYVDRLSVCLHESIQ
jgi:hypothetical protein